MTLTFFKKTLNISLSVFTAGAILATSIPVFAAWPNSNQNINCVGPTADKPCQSLAREFDSTGKPTNNWYGSDRSLNIDTNYTYEADGNVWNNSFRDNQMMTPGAPNKSSLMCAKTMSYRVGEVVSDSTASAECGSEALKISNSQKGWFFGPHLTSLESGKFYKVDLRVKVENVTGTSSDSLFSFDVYSRPQVIFNEKPTTISVAPGAYKTLSYTFKAPTSLPGFGVQTRVYSYGIADIFIDNINLTEFIPTTEKTTFIYEGENMNSSVAGSSNVSDANASKTLAKAGSEGGYLTFGPYTNEQKGGQWYQATFTLRADTNATNSIKYVTLMAINSNIGGKVAELRVPISSFQGTTYKDFSFKFYNLNDGVMQYPVFISNDSTGTKVYVDKVTISKTTQDTTFARTYESEVMPKMSGNNVIDGSIAARSTDQRTWMVFGPYEKILPTGNYRADFYIKNQGGSTSTNVGRVDVTKTGTGVLVQKNFSGAEVSSTSYGVVSLNFSTTDASANVGADGSLQFRIYNNITGNELRSDKIVITKI